MSTTATPLSQLPQQPQSPPQSQLLHQPQPQTPSQLNESLMQCDEPLIEFQWGPEEEEEEILSILWAEEEALLRQEAETQEALADLEEEHQPCSPHLKPQSNLPPMYELWGPLPESSAETAQRPRIFSMNFSDMFESTTEYQDSSPL